MVFLFSYLTLGNLTLGFDLGIPEIFDLGKFDLGIPEIPEIFDLGKFDLGIPEIFDLGKFDLGIPDIPDLGIFAHFFLVGFSAHFVPIPPFTILLTHSNPVHPHLTHPVVFLLLSHTTLPFALYHLSFKNISTFSLLLNVALMSLTTPLVAFRRTDNLSDKLVRSKLHTDKQTNLPKGSMMWEQLHYL